MKPNVTPAPSAEEIRAALKDALDSTVFAHAPQLGAFLRFVVESVLAGEGGQIKSYSIAVDALGRGEDFDPKIDPIVRVEAGRLRRALARYYADGDVAHSVIIELPLGSYVPTFRARQLPSRAAALVSALRHRGAGVGGWSGIVAAVAFVALVGTVLVVAIGSWSTPVELLGAGSVRPGPGRSTPIELPTGPIVPIISIPPFEAIGAAPPQASELDAFRGRLRDALVRFDEIEVASDDMPPTASPPARSSYRLAGLADYRGHAGFSLSLWLSDTDEGTVVWTGIFEVVAEAKSGVSDVVQRIATKLAQPYGVIYAREVTDRRVDPRYRCVVGALEYLRRLDPAAAAGIDSCLERITAASPAFAEGYALRAMLAVRRYDDWETDAASALEQAVKLAQRAVEIKPQSARSRVALMIALFARGDIAGALAEGKTAVALNPYDMVVLHSYGMRLVLGGRAEEGAVLIRRAAALSAVRPAMFEYGLFLCAYVLSDVDSAAEQPRLFVDNDYPMLLVARAVSAVRAGDRAKAQQAVDRLLSVHPGWRDNPRQRVQRYVTSASLADRFMEDLASAGLPVAR